MYFNTLVCNFVIFAFARRTLCFLVDSSLTWTSDSLLPDRIFIPTCFGQNLELPWNFIPGLAPVIDIEWHFENALQSSNESLLATLVHGHFFVEPHVSTRVEYVPGAGIRLLHLQSQDSGNYSVKINVMGSDVENMRSVMVQVTSTPITSSDRLQAYMRPAAVHTDQYHLVLSCGNISDVWNSTISIIWQTPSHQILQSSHNSGGIFDLYVPNPPEDGQYTCLIDNSSVASQCIPDYSSLLSGAHVYVEATKGQITLMQAQLEHQGSQILSQNSQILSLQSQIQQMMTSMTEIRHLEEDLFSMVLTGGSNSHEGRVEIRIGGAAYGTVCDDSWNNTDATVVCRMLGYPYTNAQAWSNAHFGEGTGPILLDDVVCQGNETHLLLCRHSPLGTHNCNHGEDAGVTCQ